MSSRQVGWGKDGSTAKAEEVGQDGSDHPALQVSGARGYPYLDACLAVITLDAGP